MTARRHHFISQCYLRGFTNNSTPPVLSVTDFQERRTFPAATKNVALEKDFHTIDIPGLPPDFVEKKIGEEFESELGPALRRIEKTGSFADEGDRYLVCVFMTLLAIKNPRMRKQIDQLMGKVAEFMMKSKAANSKIWAADMARSKAEGTIHPSADTDAMRKHILEGNFEYGISIPGHLNLEFNLVENLLPCFQDRKWTLCRGPADHTGFITSDNPVCLMWQETQKNQPLGLGTLGTQIVFPVANQLAMIGTFEGRECTIDADDDLVAIINGNILPYVTRQVYARGDDFTYAMPHNAKVLRGTDLLNDPVSKPNGDTNASP